MRKHKCIIFLMCCHVLNEWSVYCENDRYIMQDGPRQDDMIFVRMKKSERLRFPWMMNILKFASASILSANVS